METGPGLSKWRQLLLFSRRVKENHLGGSPQVIKCPLELWGAQPLHWHMAALPRIMNANGTLIIYPRPLLCFSISVRHGDIPWVQAFSNLSAIVVLLVPICTISKHDLSFFSVHSFFSFLLISGRRWPVLSVATAAKPLGHASE